MLLSFFLLSCAYSAIGLFISSLTDYPVVAGIGTFVVFFLLEVVGGMFQDIDLVRDLTYFLSIAGRTETMIGGLITTRDLAYFLLIIILFLGLTFIKMKSTQESKRWTVSFSRNLIILLVVLTLGYFSSRPGHVGYFDVTREKINTLDSATQNVLKELDGSPVTVTLYANLLDRNVEQALPVNRNAYVWKYWDKYVRFYPNIKLKYEYYYGINSKDSSILKKFRGKSIEKIAIQMAKLHDVNVKDFKTLKEVSKTVDLSNETLTNIMELTYNDKKTFMRAYLNGNGADKSNWPSQSHVSGSIRRLVRDSIPQILFLTGHYERNPNKYGEREYGVHTSTKLSPGGLINLGVDIDTISLVNNDIPAGTAVLAVADPKFPLMQQEQDRISNFIAAGGNAIFYGEPGKQHLLNPILNTIGINIDPGIMVWDAQLYQADQFSLLLNPEANHMSRQEHMDYYQRFQTGGAGANFVSMSNLSYQEVNGFKIAPIVSVEPNGFAAWIENGLYVSDSAAPVFSSAEGDILMKKYCVGLKMTRMINNREQRIVVIGDADFMTPLSLNGGKFKNGFYSWLLYNEYPVYTTKYYPEDRYLTISKQTGVIIYNVYVYVIPGMLLLIGSAILIRRKRK